MFMADDIRRQPAAFRQISETAPPVWEAALGNLGDLSRFRRVVMTGMGSSYFASLVGACALRRWGMPAAVELTSALLYYGESRLQPDDLLVVSSQSGESVEVVKLLQQLGADRPAVLAVTNRPESSVARMADAVISLDVPPDHGVAIKTYGATVLALLWLATRLTGLPVSQWADGARRAARAVELANAHAETWRQMGQGFRDLPAAAVMGRGPSMGTAWSGALLFNEVAKAPAWAEDGGEFRHGTVEAAGPGFLAVVLLSDGPTRDLGITLAAELAKIGTQVLAITPVGLQGALVGIDATVIAVEDLDELFLPVVQVVPFHWLSFGWAEARGFEPGRFRHMGEVVSSES